MIKVGLILLLLFSAKTFAASVGVTCDANGNMQSFTGADGLKQTFGNRTESDTCTDCTKPGDNTAVGNLGVAMNATAAGKIRITYPLKGPNRQIQSSNYDTAAIQKLVEIALQNNLDPYMLISIVLIESPPVNGNGNGSGYSGGYGDLPIDGLPVYESLGCFARKNTSAPPVFATSEQEAKLKPLYAQRDQLGKQITARFSEYSKFRSFVVNQLGGLDSNDVSRAIKKLYEEYPKGCPIAGVPRALSDKYCSDAAARSVVGLKLGYQQSEDVINNYLTTPGITNAQRIELQARLDKQVAGAVIPNKTVPEFRLPGNGNKSTFLCADPQTYNHGKPSTFNQAFAPDPDSCCVKVSGYDDGAPLRREFLNLMAANFVKEKLKVSAGNLAGLSLDMQKYNGTGVIGSTEGVGNNCIGGIHMGSRPYYGARVSDLIVNSVLANRQITDMVKTTSASFNKSVPSIFCKKLGTGSHSIDSTLFYNQQKSFLLSGRSRSATLGGQRFEYKAKLANGSVGVPQSAQDLQSFNIIEAKRAQSCSKFFN